MVTREVCADLGWTLSEIMEMYDPNLSVKCLLMYNVHDGKSLDCSRIH